MYVIKKGEDVFFSTHRPIDMSGNIRATHKMMNVILEEPNTAYQAYLGIGAINQHQIKCKNYGGVIKVNAIKNDYFLFDIDYYFSCDSIILEGS